MRACARTREREIYFVKEKQKENLQKKNLQKESFLITINLLVSTITQYWFKVAQVFPLINKGF